VDRCQTRLGNRTVTRKMSKRTRLSRDEKVADLQAKADELGRPPTTGEVDDDDSMASEGAYRNLAPDGRWADALMEAGLDLSQYPYASASTCPVEDGVYVLGLGNGGRKKHLVSDELGDTTYCGSVDVPRNQDGSINQNKVCRFTGVDQFPDERWCTVCRSAYINGVPSVGALSRTEILDVIIEAAAAKEADTPLTMQDVEEFTGWTSFWSSSHFRQKAGERWYTVKAAALTRADRCDKLTSEVRRRLQPTYGDGETRRRCDGGWR